jgi:hypothetical protein
MRAFALLAGMSAAICVFAVAPGGEAQQPPSSGRPIRPQAPGGPAASAQPQPTQPTQETRQRPRVDETPKWLKEWWSWTDAQRRQGGTIVNEKGGSLNPKWDDDPAIRTWRDENGFNVRPIQPQDLRSAIQMQQQVLGEMKTSIEEQEKAINKAISQSKTDFFLARDDEKSAKAAISNADLELYNVDRKWDTARYDRCPKGNPWESCDHFDAKSSWLADWDADRAPLLRGKDRAEKRLEEAQIKAQQASAKLRQAEQKQNELQSLVESYEVFSTKQKRGEPFLFMPK